MRKFPKTEKVSDLLRHAISNSFLFELEIEKLRWITITAVNVNKDLKMAVVYYTVVESAIGREEAQKLLDENVPRIKKYLSSNLRLRRIPDLSFKFDDVEEKAQRIEKILNEIPKERKDG
jgi:ribosome-binding factor A